MDHGVAVALVHARVPDAIHLDHHVVFPAKLAALTRVTHMAFKVGGAFTVGVVGGDGGVTLNGHTTLKIIAAVRSIIGNINRGIIGHIIMLRTTAVHPAATHAAGVRKLPHGYPCVVSGLLA